MQRITECKLSSYPAWIATIFGALLAGCQLAPPAPEKQGGTVKWKYEFSSAIHPVGSPALSNDGTLYLTVSEQLHAIVDTGNEGQSKANWPFGGKTVFGHFDVNPGVQDRTIDVWGVPVITLDERVLVLGSKRESIWNDLNGNGDFDGWDEREYSWSSGLFAVASDGQVSWYLDGLYSSSPFYTPSPPAVGVDGNIYLVHESELVKISLSGDIKGRVDLGFAGNISTSPVIGPDGRIYLLHTSSRNSTLYRLDLRSEDPNQWIVGNWLKKIEGKANTAFVIDDAGTVYICAGSYVQAIAADQTELWKSNPWQPTATCDSTPVLGENSVLYVGANNGALYALDTASGNLKPDWPQETDGGPMAPSPAVGSNGRIYLTEKNGTLFAFKPDGSGQAWFRNLGAELGSPVLGRDGTLYVEASDGSLYAMNTEAGGRANTVWSMYRSDTYHSNSVQQIHLPPSWQTAYNRLFAEKGDLELARRLRDEILSRETHTTRDYVKRLYSHSDEALTLFNDNPALLKQMRMLMVRNRSALSRALQGKPAEITNSSEIFSLLDALIAKSNGALKELFVDVKKDMQAHQQQGKPFAGMKLR